MRRHTLNDRVDYKVGAHSIYGSGGLSYATVVTPRPFGVSPFNGAPGLTKDNDPYAQIGDTWVISPSLVADLRFGVKRVNTQIVSGRQVSDALSPRLDSQRPFGESGV